MGLPLAQDLPFAEILPPHLSPYHSSRKEAHYKTNVSLAFIVSMLPIE